MNFNNCVKIFKKDWTLSVRKKEISLPMLILPIIFSIFMPILMMIGVLASPTEMLSAFGDADFFKSLLGIPESYNEYLSAAFLMIRMMILPLFLFVPAILPSIIASDSFAGEKERKTMESLLLLPVTKTELIIGKVLTSLVPSLLINLCSFFVLGIILNLMFIGYLQGNLLVFADPIFWTTTLLLAPLLALVNILVGTIVSSRVKDLKSAQSVNGSLITPVIAIFFVQMFNPGFLSVISIMILSAILAGICILLIDIANRLLDTEKLILML